MEEILNFKKIKKDNIFQAEYEDLDSTGNSAIEFKMQAHANGGIAVIYAPNGTGKTSLTEVLASSKATDNQHFIAEYNGQVINEESGEFHIIGDQISRNIIHGNASDYLVGANIRREYELKKRISEGFKETFAQIASSIKKEYKVSKIGDFLLTRIANDKSVIFLKDIIKTQTRGKNIAHDEFIELISSVSKANFNENAVEEKIQFIINDCAGEKIVQKIIALSFENISCNTKIMEIEQNDDAIPLLRKYSNYHMCVLCDNDNIDPEELLTKKIENRKKVYESLDKQTQKILDEIVNSNSLKTSDPFEIKKIITEFIVGNDINGVNVLLGELNQYLDGVASMIQDKLLSCFDGSSMLKDYEEYKNILEQQPQIDSEELLFIKEVISENIGPEISIIRDEENDNNFKILLAGDDFLEVDRKDLHLSTGEQNFISLSFELLLARRSDKEFVVMDDPISSFDSVYKNKIAYCIIKFLENKKQIVLTHNTDLIRLLEVQQNSCFNLYMFSNTMGGNNGFVRVNEDEKGILINLYKLIGLFQNKDDMLVPYIEEEKQFCISMIPFMRGYAHICNDSSGIYEILSGVMHGYEQKTVNISQIYKSLFGYQFTHDILVSTDDILNIDCANINVINKEKYPLLAETLKQTIVYYHLRMKVEKELVDTFSIQINIEDPPMLNQLIMKAFRANNSDVNFEKKREYRVFFTSRKTLLNEFNHFEGNMNIFQPAIDISTVALKREIVSIENKLLEMKVDFA